MMLSIITPFFNSYEKCGRLLDRFYNIDHSAVEVILVNDGSTDDTSVLLDEFAHKAQVSKTIISQGNKGPGGARNAGLAVAQGKYVWFVDSDDDIDLSVLSILSELVAEKYDFIDFDYLSGGVRLNSMSCLPGEYSVDAEKRAWLLSNFGRLCTKLLRRQWLEENTIVYPEFCIYEDNALLFFCPFMAKKFYKSDVLGYIHHEEYPSVTRSEINWRYFDRMNTALFGLSRGIHLAQGHERAVLAEKFIRLYLINTLRKLTNRGGKSIGTAARVMRQYRLVSKAYDVELNPLDYLKGSFRRKSIFCLSWLISYCLPEQTSYFKEVRRKAWGKSLSLYEASL